MCNGSTPDSDSVCGGSNPSSSAKKKSHTIWCGFSFCHRMGIRTHLNARLRWSLARRGLDRGGTIMYSNPSSSAPKSRYPSGYLLFYCCDWDSNASKCNQPVAGCSRGPARGNTTIYSNPSSYQRSGTRRSLYSFRKQHAGKTITWCINSVPALKKGDLSVLLIA